MKIQQLINCQQKNHLNKSEVGNIKNKNKEQNEIINEDVDMEELHEQFHKLKYIFASIGKSKSNRNFFKSTTTTNTCQIPSLN
uniref:Uncharacterized protein n=1 Tax=Meloidogyne enterolobii TaxID=390850 RepID=A0A6V7WS07_MELEN|nr:unnamed protein product [Meloidogyne enterolobii]